jgi:protein phosphatase
MSRPKSTVVGALSDIGLRRQENQDSYGHFQGEGNASAKGQLLVVADGMGGHQGGAVASRLAVDTILEFYQSAREGTPTEILSHAFAQASERIHQAAQQRPELASMGTTCTALALVHDRVHVMHVGDTRAYLIRGGTIKRLTSDQTWVQSMVDQGVLTRSEAERHPDRNILMQALGTRVAPISMASPEPLAIQPGDIFVLCTDGLSGQLDDEEIRDLALSDPDPQQACERLVELAKARGGEDNITVLVFRISS